MIRATYCVIFVIALLLTTMACESTDNQGDNSPDPTQAASSTRRAELPVESAASDELLRQITLRQQHINQPTTEGLDKLIAMGISAETLEMQPTFIYMVQQPNESQVLEMEALGITPSADTWIPPAGNHPYGFFQAMVPIDRFNSLIALDYVIKLDTAQRLSQPQSDGDNPITNEPF